MREWRVILEIKITIVLPLENLAARINSTESKCQGTLWRPINLTKLSVAGRGGTLSIVSALIISWEEDDRVTGNKRDETSSWNTTLWGSDDSSTGKK